MIHAKVRRKPVIAAVLALLLVLAATQLGGAALIYGKAWLAPVLIARSWNHASDGDPPQKPWPWADTRPVARLAVPALNAFRFVLEGDSGHALAFGPGMAPGVRPGDAGLVMVSGHRDTHFRFLKDLRVGDVVDLDYSGSAYRYRIVRSLVVDARDGRVPGILPDEGLLLVTCYPFDAVLAGGPLRYLLLAERETQPERSGSLAPQR